MAEIRVSHVDKIYGATKALDDVSIDFADGEFYGLLGPSGSGKTTLLRTVAGFISADRGSVVIGGEPMEQVPVEKREIGMVFQNYALFPNMDVTANIGFGLRVRKLSGQEISRRVADVLDLVQLGELGARRPHQLSGGQRQRVALARAIVTQPRVLLLDEPLGALDKALRVEMQVELKRIQREVGITTIFVTHDQEEALTLSDHIGILKDGRLVQQGTPQEVYHRPADRFAACFLGDANIFDGGRLPSGEGGGSVAVRPESMWISMARPEDAAVIALQATLRQKIFKGATVTCLLDWHGQVIKVLAKGDELAGIADVGEVWVSWPREKSMRIPADR